MLRSHFGARQGGGYDGEVELDICWPCHLIWFDSMESIALSPDAVVELFRQISEHQSDTRNIVSMTSQCPICRDNLKETRDFARGGRFSYRRCASGHGRATAFTQFLIEKQFIRTLAKHEIAKLAATVKQVRCSSCGAPVNIEHDEACTHCGAPIAVLDRDAVAKALAEYQSRIEAKAATAHLPHAASSHESPHHRAPRPLDAAAPEPWSRGDTLADIRTTAGMADLVVTGIAVLLSAAFD
jgi:hypothetical protein